MKIGSLDSKPAVAPMQNDRKSDSAAKAGSGSAAAAEPSATVQISDAASIISNADADGTLLGRIILPELPANLAWGEDGSVLFVTARTSVYRLQTKTRGAVLG